MAKILICINSLTSGGAERVTVNLSARLVEQGHQVTIAAMYAKPDFFTTDKRVGRVCLESAPGNGLESRLTGTLTRIVSLRRIIKQHKPDIVLAMMTQCAVIAVVASLGLPVKVIASERNFPGRKKVALRWALLRKILYRFAHGHVVQTPKIAQWLKTHTNASNIAIIPNAVAFPLAVSSPCVGPEDVIKKNDKLIIAIGRLHEQKGFDLLIAAFAQIAEQTPGWVLAILGAGDDANENQHDCLRQQIKQLDMTDRIMMPGRVGNVGDWYKRSSLFVLSSRYEGFPNVLLEAMAAGCACISFDCDTGPGDIIQNEKNGLLVPPENVNALADAMKRLIQNPALRNDIAANAGEIRERFSEQRIVGLWTMFFDETISPAANMEVKVAKRKQPSSCVYCI